MVIVYATDNYWPRISGMAVSIETFKRELEKRGHEVHVLCPDYPGAKRSDIEMGRKNIHRFASYELSFLLKTEDSLVHLFEKKNVTDLLDAVRPDLVHVQTEFTMGCFAIDYARDRKLPLVITSHTHFEEYIKIYFPLIPEYFAERYVRKRSKQLFNKADILLVPTQPMRDLHKRNGVKTPIDVLPTGIDDDFSANASAESAREKIERMFPSAAGRKSMLYIGRLGIEKNLNFLIDAVEEVKKRVPDVVLFVIGEGPVRDGVEYLVKEKGLQDNVFFLGYVPHNEVKNFFSYCDVFTFPSKTETQGLVTVESMRCGTPVVGIGEMGTLSVMQGDNGGFMVSDDLHEFSARTADLLTDDELRRKKSIEARVYSERFTISVLTDQLEYLYEDLRHRKRTKLFEWLESRRRKRLSPLYLVKNTACLFFHS